MFSNILSSIYFSLHYPKKIPFNINKYILHYNFGMLDFILDNMKNSIFLVKQDYFGVSSVLVSIQDFKNIKVVGLQHGLISHEELIRLGTYPGIRTNVELVYDNFFKKKFSEIKACEAKFFLLGPPFNLSSISNINKKITNLVYISSGDTRSEHGLKRIEEANIKATNSDLNFYVRYHPSEYQINLKTYDISKLSLAELFEKYLKNSIFIGSYSTLLYNIAIKGAATVWLTNKTYFTNEDLMYLKELPNTTVTQNLNQINFMNIKLNKVNLHIPESINYRLSSILEKVKKT
jgi:hypothetical protein